MKYTIFNTKWGYFGLAGSEKGLCRTQLPTTKAEIIKRLLLEEFPNAEYDKNLFKNLQEQILAYFEGENIDFNTEIAVFLNGRSEFARKVLACCRGVTLGQTLTYSGLAQKIGKPKAARAVGGVMAGNPIPLIIPCHRIIRTDGGLGGFSAPGGITLKKRLLAHEKQCLSV